MATGLGAGETANSSASTSKCMHAIFRAGRSKSTSLAASMKCVIHADTVSGLNRYECVRESINNSDWGTEHSRMPLCFS